MQAIKPTPIVERPFSPVKSPVCANISPSPDSMIHHNLFPHSERIILSSKNIRRGSSYGVSHSHKVITSSLYIKKYDRIRECLQETLGLSVAQREVALRLLRLWSYYETVYPKESQITELPGCSKATYWRTIRRLRELGLVRVINRYLVRPHAQISNLYRLDRLVLLLARYLSEHGVGFRERWLKPALTMPARLFWSFLDLGQGGIAARDGPIPGDP